MNARSFSMRRALHAGLFAVLLAATAQPAARAAPDTAAPASGAPASGAPGTPAASPAAAAPSEDIRDIRGPKFVMSAWLIPAIVLGVVLLALGGYLLWRWRRRRRRPRILLPFEVALQKLEQLRPLMQPAHAREFSIAASDIVRGYIEERFDVTATHRTTEEFLHDLLGSSNASLARHRGLLEAFLNQCDLVKFAGISLSIENMEALHQSACDFVRETAAPDPVLPPTAKPPAATSPAAGPKEAHDPLSST
jgi:Domain of unknown function (DUF4381)